MKKIFVYTLITLLTFPLLFITKVKANNDKTFSIKEISEQTYNLSLESNKKIITTSNSGNIAQQFFTGNITVKSQILKSIYKIDFEEYYNNSYVLKFTTEINSVYFKFIDYIEDTPEEIKPDETPEENNPNDNNSQEQPGGNKEPDKSEIDSVFETIDKVINDIIAFIVKVFNFFKDLFNKIVKFIDTLFSN